MELDNEVNQITTITACLYYFIIFDITCRIDLTVTCEQCKTKIERGGNWGKTVTFEQQTYQVMQKKTADLYIAGSK